MKDCPACDGKGELGLGEEWGPESCYFCKGNKQVEEAVILEDEYFGYKPYTEKFHLCFKCPNEATWRYAPATKDQVVAEKYRCDDCVSRGCGCMQRLKDGVQAIWKDGDVGVSEIINPEADWEFNYKDKLGRDLPCCEWDYLPFTHNGIEP